MATEATETRKCGACGHENAAAHHFCAQCGQGLAGAGGESEGLEPNPCPDMPGADTLSFLNRLAETSVHETSATEAGWRFAVVLGEKRSQDVHACYSGTDERGRDWITLLSVCGKAEGPKAPALLRMNGKLAAGKFSIQTLRGQDCFVLNEDLPVAGADPEEVHRLIAEIAERSDLAEAQLGGGQDIY